MSSDWQPLPETQMQNNANTASCRSKGLQTRPSSSSSAPGQAPKKKRRGSYGQSSPATSTDDSVHVIEDSGDDVEPRVQPAGRPRAEKGKTTYRAKNRVAAKRCREKTKQYEIDLANKEKKVTQERMYLDACVTALKNEVLTLKNQILQHSDCDCDMIQGYIARAASGVSISGARVPS
ncbi:bZIP transcription factor [Colletotrichum karsti]|uniref:BZIP transcription factor n=1 Tax=Colletotrichum karsti TaxID=1095194 RepID=A0A9P6IB50_9PEZI|nr:bZIP transcription factor [Colletotrichum karsti]KAF9879335.1 bZIP transcription factor [Colletotrichum karsti]